MLVVRGGPGGSWGGPGVFFSMNVLHVSLLEF